MNIAIVCYDHFTDIDTFLPWDLLNRAGIHNPDWRVALIGAKEAHTSIAGLQVPMHGPLTDAGAADAVLFTSGAKGVREVIADESWLGQLDLDPGLS